MNQNKARLVKLENRINQLQSQETELNSQISKQSLEISALDKWERCEKDTTQLETEIATCNEDTEQTNKDRDACPG